MSQPTAVFCSFRLGGADGVSVETRKWDWAIRELGFATRRVAGDFADGLRPDDTWLPFLEIDPPPGARPEPDALSAALAGADLVVVENLCSLPMNEVAAQTTAEVLAEHDGRVLFHHHDLPWERADLAHLGTFPPRRPNSLHVTINEQARAALADRGIEAHVVRNAFDLNPIPGDGPATRRKWRFAADDLVLLQPTRAIPRKEVGRGIEFAEAIAALLPDRVVRYWITGPAEDGFGPELARLVDAATIPVTVGRAARPEDAYAAADVVVFPSSWEGFGNPVIEATVASRPVVVAHYPVLDELIALGLDLLSIDEPGTVAALLQSGATPAIGGNRDVLERYFDLADLPSRIATTWSAVGWVDW
ncbi:MAG: glycosyltransferase family 4 protein [Acidimicrobiia bacterium]|nr:glycosyltransferase family 4 protein [Acidimicrobiia bacterium]